MCRHHFAVEKIAKLYLVDIQFGDFFWPAILKKYLSVWLDGARPANPNLLPGEVPPKIM